MRTGRGVAVTDPRLALAGGAALFGLGSLALGAAWVFGAMAIVAARGEYPGAALLRPMTWWVAGAPPLAWAASFAGMWRVATGRARTGYLPVWLALPMTGAVAVAVSAYLALTRIP